jgi:hypothetical protein
MTIPKQHPPARQTSTALPTFVLIAILLQSVTPVAIAQAPGGTKAKTQPDRWDWQPHLSEAAVHTEKRIYKSTLQGDLKLNH